MPLFLQGPPRRPIQSTRESLVARGKTYWRVRQLKQRIQRICEEDTSNEFMWPTAPLRQSLKRLGKRALQGSTGVIREGYNVPANVDHAEVLVKGLLTKLCLDPRNFENLNDSSAPAGRSKSEHILLRDASAYYPDRRPGLEYLHRLAQQERQYNPVAGYELQLPTDIPGVSVGFAGLSVNGYGSFSSMPLAVTFYLDQEPKQ